MLANAIDGLIQGTFELGIRYEFWPALNASSNKVLIVLHGRGDSPEGFHFFPGALNIDDFHTLFLEAPDPYGPGYSWYDLPPKQGPGIIRSRKLLFHVLDTLSVGGFSALNIFIAGFSQGSLMALDVGLRYPKPLGGIVGMSGYLFFEEEYPTAFSEVARSQRFWISHGFKDDVLSFEQTQKSVEKLRSLGIQIEWNPLDKAHTVDDEFEIPLIRAFLITQLESN